MRIAFVIQRYGTEVLGGSEHLCRLVAERLAGQHEVDVLTTCARDYVTWKNEYPEGADRIRGVTVRRFANAATRDLAAFNKYSEWIYQNTHSRADEMEWLKQQGPWCPPLLEYLRRHHHQYDVLIFFTYLYATTVTGLDVSPSRSLLVPTAHDEPAIRLEIFKEVFSRPAALLYNTESERRFVQNLFAERPLLEEVVGVGVDIPQHQPYPRMPEVPPEEDESRESRVDSRESRVASRESTVESRESLVESQESLVESQESLVESQESLVESQESTGEHRESIPETLVGSGFSRTGGRMGPPSTVESRLAPVERRESPRATDGPLPEPRPSEIPPSSHLVSRGAVFRRRHRLYGPIVLYGGRIDPGKGCEELIEYFGSYASAGGEGTLTLMGVKLMSLPEEPFIRFAGLLSDRERLQALEAATVVVVPSPYESLSLLALEAFAVGTPVLANARSEVLVEHCLRSNAGLFYADRDEFVECLKLLVGDQRLRAAMGRNGRDYVKRNYRWDVVLGKYERLFAKIRNAR